MKEEEEETKKNRSSKLQYLYSFVYFRPEMKKIN